MRRIFAFLTVLEIPLLLAQTLTATAGLPGVGDQLSLCVTNRYGDVLANPAVAQILGDGLILQRGTMEVKVKYGELPPEIRKKYEPLASGLIKKKQKEGVANAAYFAYTQQLQAEEARHSAIRAAEETQLADDRPKNEPANAIHPIGIIFRNQNLRLTVADLGFRNWQRDESNGKVAFHGMPGPSGFSLGIFVEPPANNLPGNDAVYNYFWLNMGHDSLIDAQSVKVQKTDKFIKVSYTARGEPNFNYFFAFGGHWVDLHLAKPSLEPGDENLIAAFDRNLSYEGLAGN